MFLLDTNVVSELRKASAGKADPRVVVWAQSHPASSQFVSVVTMMELELGVLQMERKDVAQGAVLRVWLERHVLPTFLDRVLPIDLVVARRCATLHVPNPTSERDALIAATALVHGMPIVTRNAKDFEHTGVVVINPWAL